MRSVAVTGPRSLSPAPRWPARPAIPPAFRGGGRGGAGRSARDTLRRARRACGWLTRRPRVAAKAQAHITCRPRVIVHLVRAGEDERWVTARSS